LIRASLSVLIRSDRIKVQKGQLEIEELFARLQQAGEEHGRSFYTTRRAEYELRWGSVDAACKLIDEAARKSPRIFNVHALRAEAYLERGSHSIAHDELKKLHALVYREDKTGERFTNLKAYLVLEASYHAAIGDFQRAKEIYRNRNAFTEQEGAAAIRQLEIEETYKRR
jgi:tetratricopeptide (TPR) repeat protein